MWPNPTNPIRASAQRGRLGDGVVVHRRRPHVAAQRAVLGQEVAAQHDRRGQDVLGDRAFVVKGVGHQHVRAAARRSRPCRCPRRRRGSAAASRPRPPSSAVNRLADVDLGVAQLVQQRRRPARRATRTSRPAAARPRTARGAGPGWRRRPGSSSSAPLQRRAFAVERPAGNQVLHGDGVVARAEPLGQVQLVRGGDRVLVEFDAEAGRVGHVEVAVDDLVRAAW